MLAAPAAFPVPSSPFPRPRLPVPSPFGAAEHSRVSSCCASSGLPSLPLAVASACQTLMHPTAPSSSVASSRKAPQPFSPWAAPGLCLYVTWPGEWGYGALMILNSSRGASPSKSDRRRGSVPRRRLLLGRWVLEFPGRGRDTGVDVS